MLKLHSKFRILALAAGTTVLLAGCNTVQDLLSQDQVDYKSTVRGDPLSLPPDLSDTQISSPQYSITGGSASALVYNEAQERAAASNQGLNVLPEVAGMKVMRSGDTRWLQINADPNQVYPRLVSFWNNEGFTINRDNPQAGIIETDWAENRAKIPGNFLRRALGSIVDMVSDSGERERFTTRLERNANMTEIYINHQRMVETAMDRDATTFRWLPAEEDPGLNAVMLSRLMVYLGAEEERARNAVREAQVVGAAPQSAQQLTIIEGQTALNSPLAADDTWRRVGTALNSAGFTIDQSNLADGTYVVRYLDTDTGEKRQAGNFLSRLWGDDGNITPLPYTVRVTPQASGSMISVYNRDGQPENTNTGLRILRVIAERF
ncbi:MAG: outer membrane protein assembly factor BamC [Alcaligenaceae bacterium]|nr:outer membrane protein assembly factor BamC [Alcaligenaceae bacterium]